MIKKQPSGLAWELTAIILIFSLNLNEWRQFDTQSDARYYGVCVNPLALQILIYAEGDITLITCFSHERFKKEMNELTHFHGEAPAAVIIINIINGEQIVEVFNKRPGV
ncbi:MULTISPECIES: hypothetical protein [Legionella]|uniref:hypothetical protein n=1 Tax=Legionella TaxID=445 RepID=UPI000F8D4359|nr:MULTISPECIES: hypothetical protein [Legionella]MCP0914967.1 hypothetical protein [Legionella sp. 27cVA30]RUR10035.1 hypothetical protein ELY14_06605 [Legionella septentrionalis]